VKIKNEILNSSPLFAHAQGRVHTTEEWLNIVKQNHLIKNKPSKEVTFVTFIQGEIDFCLPIQLQRSNIKYKNAVPKNVNSEWINKNKIFYLSNAIDSIKTEYVVCLDALDILCADDLSGMVDKFKEFDSDIVYNASRINYPPFSTFVNKTWVSIEKEYDIEDTESPYRYLNAGAFMGKTDSVSRFYKYLVENEMNKNYSHNDKSEQVRVRYGRKNYYEKNKIKIDTECKMFQTLNMSEFYFKDDSLIIK
jgi:hypothetical protein